MNGKQLKNSILQWAIQGKLVPQDPNDEPASVLLEKIRAEKARLVKEGKVKKDKNESIIFRGDDNSHYEKFLATGEVKCIDDEIPFEIPEGWEWCRLGGIIDFSKSTSVKPSKISLSAWILDLEDIEKDTGKVLAKKRMKDVLSKSDKHQFFCGNVLYSKLRPYLNKVIIADEDGFCTSEILVFDFGEITNTYAQLYLMSPYFIEYAMSDAYGVKMPRLGSKQGNNALIPIPPKNEQLRIVAKIESIIPAIERYGKYQVEVNDLNNKIKLKLQRSILQEAIQGKLVPQDPNDEPASALLERIREEKLRLVKEGKLKKKDITDSVIFKGEDNKYYEQVGANILDINEEIPFDIPNSWVWCRLGCLTNMRIGKTPTRGDSSLWQSGIYPWVSISDMTDKGIVSNTKEKITDKAAKEVMGAISPAGSLIMSFKLTVGKTAFLKMDAYHNEAIVTIQTYCDYNGFINKYLSRILPLIANYGETKDAIKGKTLNSQSLNALLIPLPPIMEQNRIIEKYNTILSMIEN